MVSNQTGNEDDFEKEDIVEELRSLDEDQIFSILSIGRERMRHLKLQKMVFILSRSIGRKTNAVPYKFGAFDEYLMEKIQSNDQDMIDSNHGVYYLTQQGKKAFELIRENFSKREPGAVMLVDTLRKMSDNDILAVSYFLYPESAENSEIKDEVNRRIVQLSKRKGHFSFSSEGDEIIVSSD